MEKTKYKYHLTPYAGRSSRTTCPNCKRQHCFSLYIDSENRPAGPEYGVCDHKKECGYKRYPSGKIDNSAFEPIKIEKVEPVYYTRQDVANYTANKLDNNLCKYLLTYCGLDAQRLKNILRDYCVGSIDGGIIFWQIDEQFRIHRGKVMWYNPDGHRTKILSSDGTERGKIKAMWQFLKRDRKFEPEMCYFGQHLITLYPEKAVILVESEKTAIIGAYFIPKYNWIATLSLNNFNAHRLNFLKEFQKAVIVCPDKDGYYKWVEQTAKIKRLMPELKIKVNDFIENGSGKEDLADLLLKKE